VTTFLRGCAIVTGSVASAYVVISIIWWFDPTFGYRYRLTDVGIPFVTGLVGFIVMVVVLMERMADRDSRDLIRYAPRRLLVVLGLVIVVALVSVGIANRRGAHWFAAAAYDWHHCHWPLSANHGEVHICVSHARWLGVKLETSHLFVAGGALFCAVSCIVFKTLSRLPKPA
jgi:hypothetical protein